MAGFREAFILGGDTGPSTSATALVMWDMSCLPFFPQATEAECCTWLWVQTRPEWFLLQQMAQPVYGAAVTQQHHELQLPHFKVGIMTVALSSPRGCCDYQTGWCAFPEVNVLVTFLLRRICSASSCSISWYYLCLFSIFPSLILFFFFFLLFLFFYLFLVRDAFPLW